MTSNRAEKPGRKQTKCDLWENAMKHGKQTEKIFSVVPSIIENSIVWTS